MIDGVIEDWFANERMREIGESEREWKQETSVDLQCVNDFFHDHRPYVPSSQELV